MKQILRVLSLIVIALILVGCTKKEYTINFETGTEKAIENMVVKEGEKIKLPAAPQNKGYVFDGWYVEDKEFDKTTEINKDMTLTAHWRLETEDQIEIPLDVVTYNVKFNYVTNGKIVTSKVIENKSISAPKKPTREGYTFEGWYNGNKKYDFKKKVTKDIVLTAKWEKIPEKEQLKDSPVEPAKQVDIKSIKLNKSEVKLEKGETFQIKTSFEPANSTDKTLTYTSDNKSVVTVDKKGLVTAISDKTKTAQIIVTSNNGKKAYLTVTATNPAKIVFLSTNPAHQSEAITVYGGGKQELEYKASVSTGEYEKLSWTATGTSGYSLVGCKDNSNTCTVKAVNDGNKSLRTVTLNVNVTRKDGKVITASKKIDIEGPFTLAYNNNQDVKNPHTIKVGNTITINPQLFRVADARPLLMHSNVNVQVVNRRSFTIECLKESGVMALKFGSAAGQEITNNFICEK